MSNIPRARIQAFNLRQQKGVALIVGLIFLIVLTLFILGSLRDVLMQERMAGSFRNQSLGDSAIESLLRNGEARLFDYVITNNGAVRDDSFLRFDLDEAVPGNADLRSFRTGVGYPTASVSVTGPVFPAALIAKQFQNATDTTSRLSKTGAYMIEGPITVGGVDLLESHTSKSGSGALYMYRITARATGGTDDYVRAGESYYLVSRL